MAVIELCSPQLRFKRFSAVIGEAIRRVLEGHQFILGREVEAFEASFAAYLGVRHCIAVNSGTDALILALRALGIRPGDEVITVSMTFTATAMAILHAGAQPRFVDVDRSTRCMDLSQLEAAINPRTAAILPVHLHGYPMDMPRVMEVARRHRLAVVEDCAQAHGARIGDRAVGSFGDAAAFSFYPTKNLGCPGDGGIVAVARDATVAARVRALHTYGWFDRERISAELGHNSRLDELHAAVLNVLLPHLDEGNRERAAVAGRYRGLLEDAVDLAADHPGAVHYQFAISVPRRDELRVHLRDRAGIETGIHYPVPLHRQPLFAGFAAEPLPMTDYLAETMLSLPVQPEVVGENIEAIARGVREGMIECKAL